MFLESSRYYRQRTVDAVARDGRTVKAVTLRKLPEIEGTATVVKGNDRLDIMAQRRYRQPTWYWHIADANTELFATDLTATTGRVISVPER
jgi:hypothetical protein